MLSQQILSMHKLQIICFIDSEFFAVKPGFTGVDHVIIPINQQIYLRSLQAKLVTPLAA